MIMGRPFRITQLWLALTLVSSVVIATLSIAKPVEAG